MKTDNFYYGSDRAGGIEDQLANDGRELAICGLKDSGEASEQ